MANEKRCDLIDRQALGLGRCDPDAFPIQNRGYVAGWNGVINLIEQAPTVDAVEVVHGRWKESKCLDECFWVCSNCKFPSEASAAPRLYRYCPNCGAKMDGDGNGV